MRRERRSTPIVYCRRIGPLCITRPALVSSSSFNCTAELKSNISIVRAIRDHHYKQLLGVAVLTSMFDAALAITQSRQESVLLYPSPAQETEGAAGRDVSQLGAQITRKNLNVQPTIKIPAGYKFNVRVNRDILFGEPYRPVDAFVGGSRK